MARITPTPLFMRDVVLTVGTDDFAVGVSSVTLTPASSTTTWTGLGAITFSQNATASWTCEITHVQDWDSESSLSRFLFENEGETVPMVFQPRNGQGPTFEADVVITPGAIGGAVNSYAESTISLGVSGRPVLVPSA